MQLYSAYPFYFLYCLTLNQSYSQINFRFSTNTKGDIIYVSNSIISCGTGSGNCTKSDVNYLYTGPDNSTLNNNTANNYTSAALTYFDDIDGDATTFNSSSSTFTLPPGVECPEVVWAGLYWGAECNAASTITGVPAAYTSTLTYANRTKVLFKVPGSTVYQNLTADANYIAGTTYHCFKNVTTIVKAAGLGNYTCANIVSKTNGEQKNGGWTIVIIYSDQAGIKRNLSVFDGLTEISSANRSVQLNINGFSTPASGAIGVRCGIVVYDGDRSSISDSLQFRGAGGTNFPNFVKLSDAVHPLNNAFNSSIANYGVPVSTRNPAWPNTLGYDASLFTVSNTGNSNLGNSATSATLKLTTGSESYRVGVVTTMIDIVDPELVLRKAVVDINGGTTVPGDTLEYTLRIVNKGNDTAINCLIYDTIPFNASFVSNSLRINNVTKTDGLSDDQAEYSAINNRVVFRVGNGANATLPGRLRINDSVTVKFRIKITNDCAVLSCGSKIYNRAFADYNGHTSNASFNSGSKPDLGVLCSTGSDYTITNISVSCIPPPDTSILISCPTNYIKLNQVVLLDNNGVNVTSLYTQFFSDASLTNAVSNTANITAPGIYYAVRPYPLSNPFCVGDVIKITVTQQPLFTDANFIQTNVSCNGLNDGAATVSTTGGTPGFSYLWSNGQTGNSIANLEAGTYTVIVTDTNACFIKDTVIIKEPLPLNVSAVNSLVFCPNSLSSITVTASGGTLPYQYKLNTGLYQPSNILSAVAGNYFISVKDANNCITTIPYNFINTDNIPPIITCPGNVNNYSASNSCNVILNNLAATATDNCKVNRIIYTTSGATSLTSPLTGINDISGNNFNVGVTTVTYTAYDTVNNAATCSFTITISDTIKPVLNCPSSQSVNTDAGVCTAIVPGISANATDNCSLTNVTYSISGATSINSAITGINDASIVQFNKGNSTVNYTATDIYGNSSTCSFDITVLDIQKPTFSCPTNLNIKAGSNCDVTVNNIGLYNITDNCGSVMIYWDITGSTSGSGTNDASGIVFNKGLSTVQYIVVDQSANADTCSFTVNIIDSTRPNIICPPNQTLYLSGNCLGVFPDYSLIASASDNCNVQGSGLSITQQPAPNTPVSGLGLQTIQLIATDDAGNSDTCSFSINKINNNPPVMNCIGAQNLYLAVNCSAVLPDYTPLIISTDICLGSNGVTTVQVPPPGTIFYGTGTETIKFIATDTSGNVDSCTATIYKIDTLAPSLNCPTAQELYLGVGCDAIIPDYTTLLAPYDACTPTSMITIIQTPAAGTITQNSGLLSITISATDSSGNSASCSFNVMKIDTISPTFVCPSTIIINNNPGECYALGISLGSAFALDDCGISSITNNAPTTFPVGNTTVLYTISDANGNQSTCEQLVTVLDTEPPSISCPGLLNVIADSGTCIATNVVLIIPVTNDNCGVDTLYNDAPTSFPVGTTIVTWTVKDIHGNLATCTQDIVVTDTEKPTINCAGTVILPSDSTDCSAATFTLATAMANDNCGVDTIYNNAPAIFPYGTTTVTWIVRDIHGNTNSCTQEIIVQDNIIPIITQCALDTVIHLNGTPCQANNVSIAPPVATDNCGIASINNNHPDLNYASGVTYVNWTITDINGNSVSCMQKVTVICTSDTTVKPICSTCPIVVCTTIDDLAFDSATTFSSCGVPNGYTVSGPDTNGCYTYTPDSNLVSGPATTCQVLINNGIADTTFVTIEQAINQFPLPIELTSFYVTQNNCIAKMYWETNSEFDNEYFVVQRSNNGIYWKDIGIVHSNRSGTTLNQYSFIDDKQLDQVIYYRIKCVDGNNRINYSSVKTVSCSADYVAILVYPNPTEGVVLIEINNLPKNTPIQFLLMDIDGKLIEVKKENSSSTGMMKVNFNLSHLPSGNYPIEILFEQYKKVVVVQKR